jgi:hypothetical protein
MSVNVYVQEILSGEGEYSGVSANINVEIETKDEKKRAKIVKAMKRAYSKLSDELTKIQNEVEE